MRFALYLSGMMASRWLMSAIAAVTLIGLLDSLANASDIADRAAELGAGGATEYLFQRLPIIFDRVLLITILLAVVLTYVSLVRRREIVALTAAGLSSTAQVLLLTPVTLLLGLFSLLIVDALMPPAVRALQSWGAPGYVLDRLSQDMPLWLSDEGRIVRIAEREGPDSFGEIEIYDIGSAGGMAAVTYAEAAHWSKDGGWKLDGTEVVGLTPGAPEPAPRWRSDVTPDALDRLISEPRDLSLADMRDLRSLRGSGSRPSFAYDAWYYHRLTRPLAGLVLVMCCVPLMQRLGRGSNGDLAMIGCLALGFGYLIFDGVMISFAEAGASRPAWAVGFPIGLFALLGVYLNLGRERTR